MNYFILLITISIGILFSNSYDDSCIVPLDNREIYRNEFTYPETIQSEHFIIHFTTSDADSQFVNGSGLIFSVMLDMLNLY